MFSHVTNPYSGNEPYQTAWQQGNDYAVSNPHDTSPQTPDFSSWGYDPATTGYIAQVWQEGALAGGATDLTGGGSTSGGDADHSGADGGEVQLPHYDANSDTLYVSAEEFPTLAAMAECPDFDSWLQQLGIDPSVLATDDPIANS